MKRIFFAGFLVFAFIGSAFAQRTVTGTVTSTEDGLGLPGVNVIVKGTASGVSTDLDGKYRIEVPGPEAVLEFSYIGYVTQEVTVGARSVIDVAMKPDVKTLGEVVVNALGFEVDRDEIGSSSSTIGGDAVAESGEKTLLDGMIGKAAGLNITSASGDPGAGARVVIRGATSITGNLQPLIVIDGVPMFNSQSYGEGSSSVAGVTQQSRLNDINPADIESIEVLKGASAAALWGSRAANGVIVITTKSGRGSGGKEWAIEVNSRVAIDRLNKEVDLQDEYGQGFLGYYDGGFGAPSGAALSWGDRIADREGGTDEFITDPNAPGYYGYFESDQSDNVYYAVAPGTVGDVHGGKNDRTVYNPHDVIFRTGYTTFNNVSINHANEAGDVRLSFSNQIQQGIVVSNSNYNRTTASINTNRYLTDWLTLSGNLQYMRTTSDRIQMGSNTSGLLLGALRNPAGFNMRDYTGTYVNVNGVPFGDRQRAYRNPLGRRLNSAYDNPLWTIDNNLSKSFVDRVIGKAEVQINPMEWLNITGRVGLDTYNDLRDDYFDAMSATAFGGFYSKEIISQRQLNSDLIIRANFSLTDQIGANFLVGTNYNDLSTSTVGSGITGFINPEAPADVNNGTADSRINMGREARRVYIGYYGTASFDFFDQVFLNAGGRLDYSSTFPADNLSTFYPSADVAWQFSKLINSSALSFGKFRAAYGQVGRSPGPYSTQTFIVGAVYTDGWGAALDAAQYGGGLRESSQLGNPNIRPEIKTEYEVGVDLRFVNDLIGLSATYYNNVTSDLIIPVELPTSTGKASTVANAAEIANQGIEIEWDATAIQNDDFSLNFYGNWFRNRNEVVAIQGTSEIALAGFAGSTSSAVVGEQLGVIYGDRWDRDESGELILNGLGFPQTASTPGVLGDPNPDWRATFGSRLRFGGLSANILLEHSQGGDIWNGTKGALAFFGRAGYTAHTTTLTADEATTVPNFFGVPAAFWYGPDFENADGTYTVRGYVEDFGAGPVLVDGSAYWAGPFSGFTGPSEQFIEDATFTRLREVSLNYDLGSIAGLQNVGIQKASVGLTGRNLLLFTDYTGVDPNTNLSGATNGLGLDYFNNPATRSFILNLNLTF